MRARRSSALLLFLSLAAAAPPAPVTPDFRAMCPYDAKLCADYDALKAKLDASTGADDARLAELNDELIGIARRTDAVAYDQVARWPLTPREIQGSIFGGISSLRRELNALSLATMPKDAAALAAKLLDEEQRADALMGDLQGPGATPESTADFDGRLQALNTEASETWRQVHELAFNVDRMGDPVDSVKKRTLTPAGKLTVMTVNPLEERVAGLRDRLQKIQKTLAAKGAGPAGGDAAALRAQQQSADRLKAKGLTQDPFAHPAAPAEPTGATPVAAPPGGGPSGPNGLAFSLTASPQMLLDVRVPPEVARPLVKPSSLFTGKTNSTVDREIPENADPIETAKTAFLRALHLTTTVGDPVGRARYAFLQTGGTCALTSQAEMYAEAHGIEPTQANLKKLEDEFFARAHATKQMTGNFADPGQRGTGIFGGGGVPDEYLGNMLDTPVKKHYLAKDDELLRAVKTGKMIMVTANAGKLWHNDDFKSGGHAVVITGAEINKLTGNLLGYYVNDTGSNEGARFVSAQQFLPAWRDRGSVFIEPL